MHVRAAVFWFAHPHVRANRTHRAGGHKARAWSWASVGMSEEHHGAAGPHALLGTTGAGQL